MPDPSIYERLLRAHFPACRLLRAWQIEGGISALTMGLEIRPLTRPFPLDAEAKKVSIATAPAASRGKGKDRPFRLPTQRRVVSQLPLPLDRERPLTQPFPLDAGVSSSNAKVLAASRGKGKSRTFHLPPQPRVTPVPLPLDRCTRQSKKAPVSAVQGKGLGEGVLILRIPGPAALAHNPRAAEDEFALLHLLHSLGLRVPAPYAIDASRAILPSPYLLMEFIPGQPDFSRRHPPDFAHQMAHELARVHAVAGTHPALSFLPHHTGQPAPTAANLALETAHFRDKIEASWPFASHNHPVLLHGDYWPGNLLWQAGRLAAIIDWEDAATGDPLADLAISRLDLLWIYDRAEMEAFTQVYLAETTIDTRSLPLWDLWAAQRLSRMVGADLAGWAAFFQPYNRADITPAHIRDQYQFFVQQALISTI